MMDERYRWKAAMDGRTRAERQHDKDDRAPARPFCDIGIYISQEAGTVMVDNAAFVPGIPNYVVLIASSGGTGGSQYPCYGKIADYGERG